MPSLRKWFLYAITIGESWKLKLFQFKQNFRAIFSQLFLKQKCLWQRPLTKKTSNVFHTKARNHRVHVCQQQHFVM
jgi:hypothetical protein